MNVRIFISDALRKVQVCLICESKLRLRFICTRRPEGQERWQMVDKSLKRMMNVDLKFMYWSLIWMYIYCCTYCQHWVGWNLVHAGLSWFEEPGEKIKSNWSDVRLVSEWSYSSLNFKLLESSVSNRLDRHKSCSRQKDLKLGLVRL